MGLDEGVVAIGPNVLVEPSALVALAEAASGSEGDVPATVRSTDGPLLALLPQARRALGTCRSLDETVAMLNAEGPVRELSLGGRFCRQIDSAAAARRAERDYLRHTNGGASESFFTKIIRRFSVPLSGVLVRLGATPTVVTLAGLLLAMASAWCLSQGRYAAGVLGAVLYYASMVCDCSDGEVARLTLRDSPFGAWLETMVDYSTYFLVLGALTLASVTRPDADALWVAALISCIGSITVGLAATVLRQKVAAADPGQFDESSARVLASASPFRRFAQWGRQWIKRSTVAHLIVALALVNQLHLLLYVWAFGATAASVTILAVGPFVLRRASVTPVHVPMPGRGVR
jgi:phosphatidylglycerophosphate synthase